MTASVTPASERALVRHSLAALKDLASTLGSYVPDGGNSHEEWVRRIAAVWNEPAAAVRLAGGLSEDSGALMAVMAWGPLDKPIESIDLATISRLCGCDTNDSLTAPVAFGAIVPVWSTSENDTLALSVRKKLVEEGACEEVALTLWPTLADRLPAPRPVLAGDEPPGPSGVRAVAPSDMAEWAARLIGLWQFATLAPLRRTQSGALHKKDRDALLREPIMAEPPPAWPGGQHNWSNWLVDAFIPCAVALGILIEDTEGYRPASPDWWAEESVHLQERFARLACRTLDASAAVMFGAEAPPAELARLIPWLPSILLSDLAARPTGEWVDLEGYLERFADRVVRAADVSTEGPVSAVAEPEDSARPRSRRKDAVVRIRTAQSAIADALRYWLTGPANLAGLVQIGVDPSDAPAVAATDQARFLTDHGSPPPSAPAADKALLLQPNLEGILYRQALTGPNLPRIAKLLRIAGIGSVLPVKLDETWSRRMFGAGFAREDAEAQLAALSAVPLARSVQETFRTWAGKADRIRVHGAATLLEPIATDDTEALLQLAESRGLSSWPIGDRLLVIEDQDRIPFDALRLVAQQDQCQKAVVCVRPIEDGTRLEVDMTKSDIALEPELARFACPIANDSAETSPWSAPSRLYRIDRESLTAARRAGVTEAWLRRFFERRTGDAVPSTVRLLWACAGEIADNGQEPSLRSSRVCVIKTDSAELLDGLTGLSVTSALIGERLGPRAAEVSEDALPELLEIARDLGIRLCD